MLKRSVLTSLVLSMALSGCATVSVIPGTSTVETSITQEQSALRQAALSFNETAVSRGWISESRGFFDLAQVLMEGQSTATAGTRQTYANLIGADIRTVEEVEATIVTDANDAAAALATVSREVDAFLSTRTDAQVRTVRADLVSFERTLVQAQQTRRSFIEAADIAKLSDTPEMLAAFSRLDVEIDTARKFADRLATEYSRRNTSEAVS